MLNNQQKEIRNKCCFLLGLMIQDRIITLLSRKILLFILLRVLRSKLQIRIIYTEAIFFFLCIRTKKPIRSWAAKILTVIIVEKKLLLLETTEQKGNICRSFVTLMHFVYFSKPLSLASTVFLTLLL